MICSMIVAWKACIAAQAGLLSCDLLPILLLVYRICCQITAITYKSPMTHLQEQYSRVPKPSLLTLTNTKLTNSPPCQYAEPYFPCQSLLMHQDMYLYTYSHYHLGFPFLARPLLYLSYFSLVIPPTTQRR